jgi:hypothetical protein
MFLTNLNMTVRLFIAAAAVLGIYAGGKLFTGQGMPTEPAQLQLDIEQLPRRFNEWTADDPRLDPRLDPRIFQAIGAVKAIDRRYRDGQSQVDLHCDVFLNYGVRVLHPPELCYSSNGFTIANGETVEIVGEGTRSHRAQLLTLDHEGQRAYCLYWYQVADTSFWNGDEQRRVVQSFRGRDTWPPMIKVMLQTSANSPEEAVGRLKSLAAQVFAWTSQYH